MKLVFSIIIICCEKYKIFKKQEEKKMWLLCPIKLKRESQRNQRSNCQHSLKLPTFTETFIEKAREIQKNIYLCFINYTKAFDYVDCDKLRKALKEMRIPDHLTCLLRNLYAGQEATVRTLYGITDWCRIEKGVQQDCLLSPCLFNLYAEYIMRNVRLDEAQARIKTVREISITSDIQMTPPLWQKVKRS